jgi:hypothetical protein
VNDTARTSNPCRTGDVTRTGEAVPTSGENV